MYEAYSLNIYYNLIIWIYTYAYNRHVSVIESNIYWDYYVSVFVVFATYYLSYKHNNYVGSYWGGNPLIWKGKYNTSFWGSLEKRLHTVGNWCIVWKLYIQNVSC